MESFSFAPAELCLGRVAKEVLRRTSVRSGLGGVGFYMAAVCTQAVLPGRRIVGGGVGPLPELQRSLCPCSSVWSDSFHSRVLKQRIAAVGGSVSSSSSSSERSSGAIVSQLQDEDSATSSTRVFKSMQDAAERREAEAVAAAIASFDAADVARAIADAELLASAASRGGAGKTLQPPRFATLRSFGAAGAQGVMTRGFEGTSVFELIAANIEASKQVKNWEVLSGRLAMVSFFTPLPSNSMWS